MTSPMPPPKVALPDAHGFFTDTLEGWGNDDLLIEDDPRKEAERENPAVFRVLDWPELRQAFQLQNDAAVEAKSTSRRTALRGAAGAGLGAALLALSPLLPAVLVAPAALICLIATLVGGTISFYHVFQRKGRLKWLANRTAAERLRQLYFQYCINNLTLVCQAIDDPNALADLVKHREETLSRVSRMLAANARERPDLIINDHLHNEIWLAEHWKSPDFGPDPATPAHSQLTVLLARLATQRLQIQLRYAEANRQRTMNAPAERHALLDLGGNTLASLVMAAALWGGAALLLGDDYELPMALVGAFGALGVTARLIQRGLGLRADAERYDWYVEAIKSCIARFSTGDQRQQILSLRDLENHAYVELRQFIKAHRQDSVL